jgi:ABC-2 type transport system permease protein
MNNIAQAVWVEMLKARRSRMPLLTALGFSLFPLALGFFMIILKDPELARRYWLISAKAQITMGVADWPTYLGFLALSSAMGGFMLFGLIGSWVFGREYSDRTMQDLLALPTSRSAIVFAKFVVVALWSTALTAMNCVVGLLVGLGVDAVVALPPTSMQVILQGEVTVAIAACLAIALVTPICFFASAGHGYLPPIGIMMLVMFLAQVIAQAGWGEYFPWVIPALYVQGGNLGTVSYVIVILTSVAGIAGTSIWWELADQTH